MVKKRRKQDVSIQTPTRKMWRRTLFVLIAVCVCFSAVGVQLGLIQLAQGKVWQQRAREQQLSDSLISAKRGFIYDTNQTVLAQTREVATVIMRPANIPDEETRVRIADDLSALLSVNRDKLYTKTGKTYSKYEIVASKLDYATSEAFIDWVKQHKLETVFRVIQDYKREYPLGSVLSCVLGFTGVDGNGLEGLEAKYDSVLAGEPGRVVLTQNGWGDELPNDLQYEGTIDAKAGNSLVLTVDSTIQQIAEKYLEIAIRETGATNRGSVIVMEVETGAILAMATKGDYDLNNPRVLKSPTVEQQIAQMAQDQQSAALLEALQKQWKNKAISEFYEPGSVFKIFTASMGLELGLVTETTPFYCRGFYSMPGAPSMKCHVFPRGHGSQTFAEAVSHSCNPAFMTLGGMVGASNFYTFFERFGFTSTTGIDMLGEARVTPLLYHAKDQMTPLDVATSSIGQTFKVTPIQMITAVSAVANGGKLMQPHVVRQILDEDGNVVQDIAPTVKAQVLSEKTADRVCAILEGVVDGGGGSNAYVPGYHVAGKTGTSVKTDGVVQADGRKNVVASFMGIAPAKDPKVAILVMIDEPQTAIRYGGTLSAPVARKILTEILPYLGLEPQYTPEEQEDLARVTPDLSGKSLSAAQNTIRQAGLKMQVSGSGEEILRQSPAAGESIPKDGTVVVYTDEGSLNQTVCVPALVGKTLTQANKEAIEAGLNVSLVGVTSSKGEAFVGSQSLEAQSEVARGTVIRLEILYKDQIE